MVYFTLILGILLSICNYLLGYTFGKFKGALLENERAII